MKLYYHVDPLGNFGDDLNPWLWEKIFPNCFDGYVPHDPKVRGSMELGSELFVGIGTLLNNRIPTEPKKIVFGSGVGYGDAPALDDAWDFMCVRGPLTAKALSLDEKLGICDPAILTSRYLSTCGEGMHEYSYIPHCSSARIGDVWREICGELDLNYIDPQNDVDFVLKEISRSKFLITEALHGAIIADALRIPWVPVRSSSMILDFKWQDWGASLGLRYEPVIVPPLWEDYNSGFVNKSKSYVKIKIIERELRKVLSQERFFLSELQNIERAISRFDDKIDLVGKKYFDV